MSVSKNKAEVQKQRKKNSLKKNGEVIKQKKFNVDNDIGNWSPADKMCYFIVNVAAGNKGPWEKETIIQYMKSAYLKPFQIQTDQLQMLGLNVDSMITKKLGPKGIVIKLPQYVYLLLSEDGALHLNFGGDAIPFETTKFGGGEGTISFEDLAITQNNERMDTVQLSGMGVYATLDDGTEVEATVKSIVIRFRSFGIIEASTVNGLQINYIDKPAKLEIDDATVWYGNGKSRFKGTFDRIIAKEVLGTWKVTDFEGKVNVRRETGSVDPSISIPIRGVVEEMIIEYFNTEVLPRDILVEDNKHISDSASMELFLKKWKF